MTTQTTDSRLVKVQAFALGKTYNGHTVEARTACFVTFEGMGRKKVSIVDGVEVVGDIKAVIEEESESTDTPDIEIYNPVATTDGSHVITDGSIEWKLQAINDNTQNAVLVPVDEANDPDGRTVRLVSLAVFQAILAKKEAGCFNVGQIYEDNFGCKYTVKTRAGDFITFSNLHINLTLRLCVDDMGKFVKIGDRGIMRAIDTPSWFHRHDDIQPDIELARMRMSEDLQADRAALCGV